MTKPLLTTKLYLPNPRSEQIPRPRLIERLNSGLPCKLTLVSAPAGFGKTTVLSAWAQQLDRPVAWLSLDTEDNHPDRFLAYFIAAIQTVGVHLNIDPGFILQSSQLPPIDTILTTIINSISSSQTQFSLILDDFHLIETFSIHQALAFLLDHLPPQLHLVIATRSDPNLPLARLRGRGQINELRAADLRFTANEAGAFIHHIVEAELSPEQINALNTRTEGWAAGLQMAAVSMRSSDDIPGFITSFSGDHRYIVDYLVDEVLTLRSPATRDFLLQTSILEHLSAPLCNAVTELPDTQPILMDLEQDNLFIIPLDQCREYYRYHHLFADMLRHHLKQTYPDRIDELHARASRWLDENGFIHQAIKHALVMDDKYLAADLIEHHARALLYQGQAQVQNLLVWFEQFSEKMLRERPVLSIYQAWATVFDSPLKNIKQVERILAQVQQSLSNSDLKKSTNKIIAGHVASIKGLLSQPPIQTDHDPQVVLAFLNEAQSLLPSSEIEVRSANNINMGYEYLHLEDTEAALKANQAAFADGQAGNNHLVVIVSIRNQALIAYYLGELSQAVEICQNGIASFNQYHIEKGQPFPGLGILFIMLGYLFIERGELEKADIELTKGFDLLQWFGEYEALCLGLIALTRLLILKGDDEHLLQSGERIERHWSTCADLVETLRMNIEISRFEGATFTQAPALAWAQKNQPEFEPASDFQGISPWAETRHLAHLTWIQTQITLARLDPGSTPSPKLQLQPCLDYLDRRLQLAQQRRLVFRIIEYSIFKSLVLDALGKTDEAVTILSQALSLAKPKGFCRVFLDKGHLMAQLLRKISKTDCSTEFSRQLLAVFEKLKDIKNLPPPQNLVEPLSERELEVLQLVAAGLTNREISERLFLALDTVKGHNRNIYGKLGVKNRTQAINKAASLKIITPQ